MTWIRAAMVAAAAGAVALLATACGDDRGAPSVTGAPTLRSSPIPTVPLPTATPADCTVPEPLEMPADFPDEIPVPPEYVPTVVERSPNLVVQGLAMPPIGSRPDHSIVMSGVLDGLQIRQGWTARLNARAEGLDYTLTAPDGRELHVNATPRLGCPGHVLLTYDALWLTDGE